MEIIILVRIGNLLVPNNNYVKFEEWLMPILDKLLEEQNKNGVVWTPSKIIHRLNLSVIFILIRGYRIFVTGWDWRSTTSLQYTTGLQSEFCEMFDSEYHCDYLHCRNDIPVISPALTDGSLGDMLFFHSFKNPGIIYLLWRLR